MRIGRWFAIALLCAGLLRSIVTVWFTSEVIATPATTEIAAPAQTDRVVLVVIDGLRYDTALESDLMPQLQALGSGGAQGMALASLVTMTGLGVRTLGTGTSPALADILLETKLPPVTFDNVFAALRARGGHIAWLGNTAWRELFGEWIDIDAHIDTELGMMARANNVWAADRVIVRRALHLMARTDWQLCVVHLGGLDNASHRFTPFGEQFRAKARSVDSDIAVLVAAAQGVSGVRTTVIITSDHGTSDRGHHGSGEPITRRTPLVLTGAAVAHGRRFGDVHQTDVAPTIAALLGLPLPAPSEGVVLLDALDLPAADAAAVRAANARQLARYASAYAGAHDVAPPVIDETPAGMRRLGEWIEETRARSGLAPAAWALALLAAAVWVFGPPRPRWSARLGGAVAALVLLEVALVGWKLQHRFLEMKMHDVYDALHASDTTFQLVVTLLAAAAGTWAARRWWPATRWAVIAVMLGAAALADSLAIPAAIAIGCAAAAAAVGARGRQLAANAAAAVAGCTAIAAVDVPELSRLPLDVIAPLALGALGAWLGPARLRGRLALGAGGAAAALVRFADNPALPYRATLVAIAAGALVLAHLDRDDRPVALLGWAGAIALAMLSRAAQEPGLVAWCAFAALTGRSLVPVARPAPSDDRAALTAALATIAFRFACFALFEGAFEFSRLEVWLAYEGNPATQVAFGAAIIAIKLALPLAIGLALTTAHLSVAVRRTAIAWTVAFLCLRIAHIAIGMTAARGTFYSPYLDSGQLAFTYLMLLSAPVVLALFAAAGALTQRPQGSGLKPQGMRHVAA